MENSTTIQGPPYGPYYANGTIIVVFYDYWPNQPAAYTFMALYALATIAHFIYLVILRPRPWYFVPFVLAGIGETFGYYGRSKSADKPDELGPWIMQNLLILASPPFFAATIYMAYGRVTHALRAESLATISPRWVTRIYIPIDVLCILSQLAGTVMPASGSPTAIAISRKVILGGLIFQLVALTFFVCCCYQLHRRLNREQGGIVAGGSSILWRRYFRGLETVTLLLIMRSLVRMVEYIQGDQGFVATHEIFLYVFDAAPMLMVLLVFLIFHPQRLVQDANLSRVSLLELDDDANLTAGGPLLGRK